STPHLATTDTYPLSLHDALPIFTLLVPGRHERLRDAHDLAEHRSVLRDPLDALLDEELPDLLQRDVEVARLRLLVGGEVHVGLRSEEHTSELQSPYDLVCRLLLE